MKRTVRFGMKFPKVVMNLILGFLCLFSKNNILPNAAWNIGCECPNSVSVSSRSPDSTFCNYLTLKASMIVAATLIRLEQEMSICR